MQPDSHLPESAKRLKDSRKSLWTRAEEGSVSGFAWEYTHLVDQYFEERLGEIVAQPFAFTLVAVGGYGRGRLCPGSDIDILLLFKRRIPRAAESFVKKLLYPLWDLGLDLGHGVRTVSDCVALARKDFQVLASLLDARPLAGDAEVFETFRCVFNKKVLQKKGKMFTESLREHNQMRAVQYGDATGMLESELKNGLGGLRDGQQVFWLSRVLQAGVSLQCFCLKSWLVCVKTRLFLIGCAQPCTLLLGARMTVFSLICNHPRPGLWGLSAKTVHPKTPGAVWSSFCPDFIKP